MGGVLHRNQLLTAAYLRLTGVKVKDVAAQMHRKPGTIWLWAQRADWPEIEEEARKMWIKDLHAKARYAIEHQLEHGLDGDLALKVLERGNVDRELAPAKQTRVLEGSLTTFVKDLDALPTEELERIAEGRDNGHGYTVSPAQASSGPADSPGPGVPG